MVSNDVFTVWIRPEARGSMVTAARLADTGVEHVVIRPRGDKEGRYTVQPLTLDIAEAESVTNLFGASVQLEGVVATFASADVIAIAEGADVEVILITTGGEFKCNSGRHADQARRTTHWMTDSCSPVVPHGESPATGQFAVQRAAR